MEPAGEQARPGPGGRMAGWAATMLGHPDDIGVVHAHGGGSEPRIVPRDRDRLAREEAEDRMLAAGATRASGAGNRLVAEEADRARTCFERDRDRILHSAPFRRLAGKTQVFVFPRDHQRTRLTHALEVAQVATAVSSSVGLNVALTEAIALGHDCGHGPGGHASEDAFSPYLEAGYDHAVWGADVVLAPLNLCAETLDGIRNHSWSLPSPHSPEGVVVSWADRCAYCAHDLEDAISAGIVDPGDLPDAVVDFAGRSRSSQLRAFIAALVDCVAATGQVGMRAEAAGALAELRRFNYERIYTEAASRLQAEAVVAVLRALVDFFVEDPSRLPASALAADGSRADGSRADGSSADGSRADGSRADGSSADGSSADDDEHRARRAIAYVGGMTDRFAFETAVSRLGWDPRRLPRGIDSPGGLGA